jgi:hypothetical protein
MKSEKLKTIKNIIENISGDDEVRIGTTNKDFFGELLEGDFNYKRYFHYIIIDKKVEIKPFFRALRNGGYILSLVKYDENYLQDIIVHLNLSKKLGKSLKVAFFAFSLFLYIFRFFL